MRALQVYAKRMRFINYKPAGQESTGQQKTTPIMLKAAGWQIGQKAANHQGAD